MQVGETIRVAENLTAAAAFTITSATHVVTNEATGAVVVSGSATITGAGTANQTISFLFTPASAAVFLVTFTYAVSGETILVHQRLIATVSPSGLEILRQQLRGLIGDPASPTQTFTNDELEFILDCWRRPQDAVALTPVASYSPSAGKQYLTHVSEFPFWSTQVTFQSSTYASLTPATADPVRGRWTFSTEPDYPVLATGSVYDLYGAASDALAVWANKKARDYDFESNTQRFKRSQMRAGLIEQSKGMAARAFRAF
jgi:hypothetical protein